MSPPQVSRHTEAEAISNFLTLCSAKPAGLLLAGEAGIGKTTLWMAAVEQARARGMHVLTARAAATESVMAYISLSDLLSGVEAGVLCELPEPQRLAVDRVLLQVSETGVATDQRAVAAAFLSAVEILAEDAPVLVAIDDLQWLDPSSSLVLGVVTRRIAGPVGLLGTVRTADERLDLSWLQLPPPDIIQRIDLQPLTIGGLQQVVTTRLGRTPSRRTMVRIHEASGGNPFYAIELARAVTEGDSGGGVTLPDTLSGLVAAKIAGLDADVRETLLAAACLAAPTVDLVSQAIGVAPETCALRLTAAETQGIIAFDGDGLRFTHPLLAAAVNTDAAPSQRRDMHRRLAAVVDHPELRARHLALGATHGDPATLEALDAAADLASIRGAPAAAAEFIELAIELGGDTPERQIHCATFHFNAGDAAQARARLEHLRTAPAAQEPQAAALALLGLWSLLDGSSREAADLLQRAVPGAADDDALLVQILIPLSFSRLNIGEFEKAASGVDEAVVAATRLGQPHLLSQALAMSVLVRFIVGEGLNREALQRALELEEDSAPFSAMLNPTLQHAELLNATGQFNEARRELRAIRQRYIDRGAESELMVVSFHSALNEIWSGNFAEAAQIGEDAMVRARQLDSDLPMSVALMIQAAVAAYVGEEQTARRNAGEALATAQRCDSPALVTVWPTTTLGFLEVSLGNYAAALSTLEPLLMTFAEAPRATEIFVAPFVPDAAEALIQLGRLEEAETLIDVFERNGRDLDRPWMLATGARARAMLLAAQRDPSAALRSARQAMAEHDRLPMPFERARTQLILGELQRRQRSREQAAATLRSAEAAFVALGTPLWAARARTSLERIRLGSSDSGVLTSAEQRVAELAAAGKTNHDIASSLFISPKTVEVHLSRIYRKLDIRSRAELGRRLDRIGEADPS
jgi:DNA-binding CsgD family transcriptional regulator/tetratricopeptide (TPR) repeat protein